MNITEVMQLPQITIPCGNMNFMKVQRIHLKYEMNYNCSKYECWKQNHSIKTCQSG